MPTLSEDHVRNLLSRVADPHSGSDLVSLGWLRGVGIDGGRVSLDLRATYPIDGIRESLLNSIRETLESDELIESATVNLDWRVFSHKVQGDLKPLDQ